MRKMIIFTAILLAINSVAYAEFFELTVKYADMSELSPEGLETLKNAEFEVFLANVKLSAAKAEEQRLKSNFKKVEKAFSNKRLKMKAAKREYGAAKADYEAAKADYEATKAEDKARMAKQEKKRMREAEKALKSANDEIKVGGLWVKLNRKEVKVQQVSLKKAKLALELAKAKRDLSRLSIMAAENVPSMQNYKVQDFEYKLKKIQENYKKAIEKEERENVELKKHRAQYEKKAGQR